MSYESARTRVLRFSGALLPFALAFAFAWAEYSKAGSIFLLALCAWYALWNFRMVIESRWALLIIGFFAAIALKDGIVWAFMDGRFLAFQKSGSRVLSLFGAAAMLSAYPREEGERIFGIALGLLAAAVAAITVLERLHKISSVFNANSFGMLFCWFPLFLAAVQRRKGGWRNEVGAIVVLLVGGAAVYLEARYNAGSRTSPLAFLVAVLFVYAPGKAGGKRFLMVEYLFVVIGIAVLSTVFIPRLNTILAERQRLWFAYLSRVLEHPLAGWGYMDEKSNSIFLNLTLPQSWRREAFVLSGPGPHNSFLAMLFENGVFFAIAYIGLLGKRLLAAFPRLSLFDVSLSAYLIFMFTDAMAPGGISFLGFFLGACILARDSKPDLAKA